MTVTANSVVTPQTPSEAIVQFVGTTDGTATLKTLVAGGTNGTKVFGMFATNDGTAHNLSICLVNAVGTSVINTVSLTANAGKNGTTAPIACMALANWPGLPVDGNGNPYFYLTGTADSVQLKYATAQATTDTIVVMAQVANF